MPYQKTKSVLAIISMAVFLNGCATTQNNKSVSTSSTSGKNRLGYVQSKSQDVEFKKFEYQFSMDMTTSMVLEPEDRQYFNLCKINAGKQVPAEDMVETCSLAIQAPGISQKSKTASYYNRGLIKQNLDRLADARNDFNAAIALDTDFGDGYLALASLDLLADDTGSAQQNIQSALTKKLKHPAYAHYLLGHVLETENKYIEARAEYRRALALKPNWRDAINRIDRIGISWPES